VSSVNKLTQRTLNALNPSYLCICMPTPNSHH